MFVRTTAINKILALNKPTRGIQGGTSSGKTHGIVPILADRAMKEELKITVVAETIPAAKDGAVEIFKQVLQETGRWSEDKWKRNPMEYTFANGSRIQFKSFDSVGKAKASGKRDILFINEANHIPFAIADALMTRSGEVYLDWNPDHEFWFHEEVLTEEGVDFIILTYKDNEGIPALLLRKLLQKKGKAFHDTSINDEDLFTPTNIKNEYWANWWRVYGLGQTGSLDGVVFTNWEQIDTVPPNAELLSCVLDFGYTNDPTAMIAIYKMDNIYYLDEIIYREGLTNRQIFNLFTASGLPLRTKVIADSAEPKSIQELKNLGMNVVPASKGVDSIRFGIDKMQEEFFRVTKRSTNLKDELRRYKWATDKLGNLLNKPMDAFNHAIDAVRYYFTTTKKKKRAPKSRRK